MITVGQSVVRRDALAKVTGSATYARDLSLPGMWHMKLVFAGRPRANSSPWILPAPWPSRACMPFSPPVMYPTTATAC